MPALVFVGAGGFLGAICRYLFGELFRGGAFPYSTLLINVSGCLLLGFLGSLESVPLSPQMRLFLMVGFAGAYTTFSAFGFETWQLLESGRNFEAFLNILSSNVLCFAAVFSGVFLARFIAAGN
ncbi:MAG TPA: fluoride efflux transporter CrcB [Cyanobacteria bacterium UBA8530]|nr:fluoride efflux transporter CrcB [Cyanobacteria bacterium UBA8530]